MKPNIILITVDQMRADCIGAMGHPDVKTPFLDTMIRHGTAFCNAYSATPTCIPARAALFTGLSQSAHGRVGYQDCVDWNYETTLPALLADGGYHTQCVGKMHVWPPRKLMGFHNVELHDGFLPHRRADTPAGTWWNRIDDYLPFLRQQAGYDADISDSGIDCNSWVARPWPLAEHLHPTNWTVTRSLDFLRRRDPTKPFFLWSSFVAPHPPFLPPECYFNQYIGRALRSPAVGDWARDTGEPFPDMDCFEGRLDDADIHRMQAGYYGSITHIDHQIGRLLRALKDEGLTNNTVILFTSDHGEMLGDHHMFRKSQSLQGSVQVPMLLYDPGKLLEFTQNGPPCPALAELRDVLPTLLGAAGLEIPAEIEGVNLLELLRGGKEPRAYLHGEHAAQQQSMRSSQYIVTETMKYIWYSDTGREFLFDLEHDPRELNDLSQDEAYSAQLSQMRQFLIRELDGREEGYSDGQALFTRCMPKAMLSHPMPALERRALAAHVV